MRYLKGFVAVDEDNRDLIIELANAIRDRNLRRLPAK